LNLGVPIKIGTLSPIKSKKNGQRNLWLREVAG
jgi:hypothetical protein